MDDLQDAIEDAQFINAMHDDTPKPTKEWKFPTLEEVDAYVNKLREKNPYLLELEGICSTCLGLYLYVKYLKESGDKTYGNFLYDIAKFRNSPPFKRIDAARAVMRHYLLPSSAGRTSRADIPPNTSRTTPVWEGQVNWGEYIDSEGSFGNAIGVRGQIVEDILTTLTKDNTGAGVEFTHEEAIPNTFFDKIDSVVFAFLKDKHWETFKGSPTYRKYFNFLTLSEKPVTEDDFTLFRVLGRGGFGVVNGCKKCQTGQLYAMKVLDRKRVKLKKSETLCMTERNILLMLDSPFVVCLKYAFMSPTELFLILDLMVGGDLGYHLYRKGMFSKREAKYYIARTLLGLKALHDINVVFRDLKPDNILMDAKGRTKLSDLGLAVRAPRNGLTGACGTRGYWAPEMLRRDEAGYRVRYNLSVDWFSFGCVLYEFLSGVCPFRTEVARNWGGLGKKDKEKAIDLAVQEMDPFFDPEIFDATTQDFCSKLLIKDGKTRLGANGPGEVMAHAYFDDINWDEHRYDLVPPPCVPRRDLNVASQSEIGTFGDDVNAKKLELTDADHEIFAKWDYIRPNAFLEEVVTFMQYEDLKGPIKIIKPSPNCCSIS
mmetsp:Transcript_1331/g.2158  ORF Transcript_1331/g.2158 Transcript_1331/m.2158 type:complete len:599 (-) Transcript_1331:316-2112(-)